MMPWKNSKQVINYVSSMAPVKEFMGGNTLSIYNAIIVFTYYNLTFYNACISGIFIIYGICVTLVIL